MAEPLVRPRNRIVAGVCAGLARRFGISATAMRVLWAIGALFPGPLWVAYIALWIIMPNEPGWNKA